MTTTMNTTKTTPPRQLVLVKHEKTTFEDQTVYLTGHAFIDCRFLRCTVVNAGTPYHVEGCTFEACNFRIECSVLWGDVASREGLRRFMDMLDAAPEAVRAAA